MNPSVVSHAESARAWLLMSTVGVRERLTPKGPSHPMPLPAMARLWPHVGPEAYGVLHWPSYRWTTNAARRSLILLWPKRWTGQRHPMLQRAARGVLDLGYRNRRRSHAVGRLAGGLPALGRVTCPRRAPNRWPP